MPFLIQVLQRKRCWTTMSRYTIANPKILIGQPASLLVINNQKAEKTFYTLEAKDGDLARYGEDLLKPPDNDQ